MKISACDYFDDHDVDDDAGVGKAGHRNDENTEPEEPGKVGTWFIKNLPRK